MKNKNYIGKKTIYIILAAAIFLFGNGNKKVVSFAEEITTEEITAQEDTVILEQEEISENGEQDLEVSSSEQEEYSIKFANDKEENITLDSVSTGAITITSGGGLKVEPLSIRVFEEKYNINGKHLKLNFSYQLLGCVKVDSYLNVREERSTDAEIAGKLSNNTFCDVLEIYRDGWVKIKSGKVCGYVAAEYLLVGERAEEIAEKKAKKTIKVNTSVLNVRSLPSTSTKTYGQIKRKSSIGVKYENVTKEYIRKLLKKNKSLRRQLNASKRRKLLKSSNLEDWICVKYNGKTAFVSKDYAKVVYTVKTGVTEDEKANTQSEKIVKYAKKFLGNRYVYGGSSLKRGTDCSGFVMRVYQHFGYRLSRSSAAQARNGRKVKRSNLKPGDLLFYKKRGRISHVSMYIGDGKVIHASNEKNGIIISSVGYRKACRYVRILKG